MNIQEKLTTNNTKFKAPELSKFQYTILHLSFFQDQICSDKLGKTLFCSESVCDCFRDISEYREIIHYQYIHTA